MVLLAGKAIQVVETMLCGTIDPAIGPYMVLNHAGMWLCGSRDWTFLRGGTEALDLVAGQSWVALPEDTGGVLSVTETSTLSASFELTSLDVVMEYRNSGGNPTGSVLYGAIVYDWADIAGTLSSGGFEITPTTDAEIRATKIPGMRLELYPTPSSAVAGGVVVNYRRMFRTVSEDTDTIFLPEWMHLPFLHGAAVIAKAYDEGDFIRVNEALANLQLGPIYRSAQRIDSGIQRQLGVLRGGAVESQMAGMPRTRTNPVNFA